MWIIGRWKRQPLELSHRHPPRTKSTGFVAHFSYFSAVQTSDSQTRLDSLHTS
ncbi:hypothetical protein SAMN05421831_11311 [Allopseudospirillum japonicum]|uniref:Uncharacterized protein n=1 Tax=Allopseudospirillum japonicum TaxID=64971 RepID=A0A1H6UBB2_9GAMM|nr:hypothetical protein SAMN05421831_11311 [Allopseudospirillum japonicum]